MTTHEHRQPTHREDLERTLVSGAASHLAQHPCEAGNISVGIKTVLDALAPVAPRPVALASELLYPAIESAMGELSKLHPGFNMEVNRAFNLLHDAFWSECPAPASAAPKRPETPAVEPAGLPVIDPGPDPLELGMERAHKIQDEALLAGATGREDMRLLCGAATFTVPIEQEIQAKAGSEPLARHPLFTNAPLAAITTGQDATIEQEIQAKGKTAARVTPGDIEANIVSAHYFTAADGVCGTMDEDSTAQSHPCPDELELLTFCVLVLRNGFTVTGESACASFENFDAEIGRKIARQNAVQKIWPLMGYELRTKLADS